ncbi:MAG: GH92 family glycosyl hydrolase [Bacteroidota bacterium]
MRSKYAGVIFLILMIYTFKGCSEDREEYSNLVNVFIGTAGEGHTYPGVSLPFGMVQLSPDTRLSGQASCGGYYYPDSSIIGFSHTHLSGVGEPEYRDILFMPTVGAGKVEPGTADTPSSGYRSSFSHLKESAEPGTYSVLLEDYNVRVDLTATARCGFHKYRFPETDSANIIIDLTHPDGAEDMYLKRVNDHEIEGLRRSHGWAWDQYVYFVARFSKPFLSSGWSSADSLKSGIALLHYKMKENEELLVKVGISAVSVDGARKNLNAEIPDWDFDLIKRRAKESWNSALKKIEVEGGTEAQRTIFYTSLYHAFLSPDIFMDVDSLYRGIDHQIHQAKDFTNYSVFSLWDTFRGLHPLFTIINQQRTTDFIKSLLTKYEQGGRLPMWPLAGNYTDDMLGYHAVPVIVDAYIKGIRDYDIDLAFEAIRHSADLDRLGLKYYKRIGYLPYDRQGESVSKTLEYCYNDWSISQMAKDLGEEKEHASFHQRAHFYKNVFDPSTRFMRGRGTDRKWIEPFDPLVNSAYSEGNAYQYLFVPHDIDGIKNLMGGERELSSWLDKLFSMDQYDHGNEPSHHLAYLYNYTGEAWKTQKIVNQVLTQSYANSPDGLAGNEDCGQMSAWYILSSMGFYSVTPGQDIYAIGTPLFKKVKINLENGNKFIVKTKNSSPENIYIQSATLNGEPFSKSYITHHEIMNGSELLFVMGSKPNKNWGKEKSDRPYSENGEAVVALPYVITGETLFLNATEIVLGCDTKGAEIRYTLDGSSPTENSAIYVSPIKITETVTVKMRAFCKEMIPGSTVETEFIKTGFQHPVVGKNLIRGLNYEYFERFFVTTADFDKVSPLETGITDSFNLDKARKETYFGLSFRGYVKVPEDGIYKFYLESNDGSRLFIGGKEIIENDGNHGAIEEQGSVGLQSGLHEIKVNYFQCGGGEKLKVSWEGPGFSKRLFYPSELFCEIN